MITKSKFFSNFKGSEMAEYSLKREKVRGWGFWACPSYKVRRNKQIWRCISNGK